MSRSGEEGGTVSAGFSYTSGAENTNKPTDSSLTNYLEAVIITGFVLGPWMLHWAQLAGTRWHHAPQPVPHFRKTLLTFLAPSPAETWDQQGWRLERWSLYMGQAWT